MEQDTDEAGEHSPTESVDSLYDFIDTDGAREGEMSLSESEYTVVMETLQKMDHAKIEDLIWKMALGEPHLLYRIITGTPDHTSGVITLFNTKGKIQAIKWYREKTGLGLKESKLAVEEILESRGIEHSPTRSLSHEWR